MGELERSIEKRVVDWAKGHGWRTRKMNGLGYNSWPDRMFLLHDGLIAFVEFKRLGKVPTEQQLDLINELKGRGFNAEYFDNSDGAIQYLKALGAGRVSGKGRPLPGKQQRRGVAT